MKRYLVIIMAILSLGCMISCTQSNAQVAPTHVEYDELTLQTCAEDIWDLFYQLQGCPAMMEEVQANPLLSECYECADKHDCINCACLLLFKLWQTSDVWADTLGESEPADYLIEDVVYILHEQTLLDEYLLQQQSNHEVH